MTLPRSVKIVEVSLRDGLQNEKQSVPTAVKLALIARLADAGVSVIEAASFVSPKWVPQMGDSAEVMRALRKAQRPGLTYTALAPNMKGFEAALAAGCTEVAVFGAASEAFSQKNINCSIAESLERFRPVAEAALKHGMRVRGYISCVVGCPYQGAVEPAAVAQVAQALSEMGCYEISLGDTIGAGTPKSVRSMIEAVSRVVPMTQLAGHYHDTYGMAIANIYASLELGMAIFDSSVAGLGGCPYSPGASGNVASEDVIYLLNGLGIATGIDLEKLAEAGRYICEQLHREPASRVAQALLSRRSRVVCA
ncbi:MAG: hydroxymethylglutaryl-CoA lyase [Betaproteobacteria bacterium]|nr:hydroxymethylglutaryl-CoA lyase [Betaproteobacteria bacterium]